jgi:nucleoside-diphosphate-sugar epimerase
MAQSFDIDAATAKLAGERFLVTGSEGCIGSWVVATIVRAGGSVVAGDLATTGRAVRALLDDELVERVDFVTCDITEPDAIARIVAEHGITRIVHVAALQIPFVAADPLRGADVNVLGTVRVLEAARHSGGQVRGISYASSSAVFGEEDPHRPATLYGALKACDEAIARFYARDYETPTVGLRPCVVYGPNRDQGLTSALTTALKAVVRGEAFAIPFGGKLDLQYTQDVAWTFILSALAQPDGAPVFDLHGDVVDVAHFVELVERARPDAAGLLTVGDGTLPGRLEFEDASLRAFLGELPKTPLRDGIALTLDAFEG